MREINLVVESSPLFFLNSRQLHSPSVPADPKPASALPRTPNLPQTGFQLLQGLR